MAIWTIFENLDPPNPLSHPPKDHFIILMTVRPRPEVFAVANAIAIEI